MSRRETYHAPLRDREEAGRIVVSVRSTSKLASFAIAGTVNSVLTGQAIPADSDTTLPRGKLPTRIPAKHQLLLAALRKLGKPVTNEWSGGIWAQGGDVFDGGRRICAVETFTGGANQEDFALKLRKKISPSAHA